MPHSKIIPIGSDHAGFELKEQMKAFLAKIGYEVKDYGTFSDERADYPDFGHAVAKHIENTKDGLGVIICGSGNGINMTANKHAGIRSALCWNVEVAKLAREHNNANIIALPARFISASEAEEMVAVFLTTEFEGGRHAARVDKISC